MLTLSDLSWTGTRWEVRTADGFVGLDKLLDEIDVNKSKGAMYHYQQATVVALQDDLICVIAERDAALNDLNGYCWACANGRPAKIGTGGLTTCDHMQKLNSLARGGRCKCDHWQWRGPRKEGDCNDE